eukprot:g13190.t1
MKVIAIDPGLVNLGVVIVERGGEDDKKFTVLYAEVLNIARKKDSDACKVASLYQHLIFVPPIRDAGVGIVENQNFGQRYGIPDNMLVQFAAGSVLLAMGCKQLIFQDSYDKFSHFGLKPTRKKYKELSKKLAAGLISKYLAADGEFNKKIKENDHLSDAFCMAMSRLCSPQALALEEQQQQAQSQQQQVVPQKQVRILSRPSTSRRSWPSVPCEEAI